LVYLVDFIFNDGLAPVCGDASTTANLNPTPEETAVAQQALDDAGLNLQL